MRESTSHPFYHLPSCQGGFQTKPSIAVVGAGPAGLTFALAARQVGLRPEVFDRAPDFRRIGGGVLLHGNGLRALQAVGLDAAFGPMLLPIQRVEIILAERGRTFVRDFSYQPPPHDRAAVVMRYCLQEKLLEATRAAGIPVHFGRPVASVKLEPGPPVLSLKDGTEREVDVVIGADGVRSRVRESVGLLARLRALGEAYLRGISERPPDACVGREHLGPGGRRFGILPLPNERSYFYCTAPPGILGPRARRVSNGVDW